MTPIWWVHPLWVVAMLSCISIAVSFLARPDTYAQWGSRKLLTFDHLLVSSLGVLSLMLGVVAALALTLGRTHLIRGGVGCAEVGELRRAYSALLALTLLGYALWVLAGTLNGAGIADLAAVLQRDPGAISRLKALARPIGGVTTLTQFGPVAVGVGTLLWRLGSAPGSMWVIILLAGARAVFYAERLALLEVVVPALVVIALSAAPGTPTRRAMRLAPLWGFVGLFGLFAVGEYFRSWIYYSDHADSGFLEWVGMRLAAYYGTAVNNGALFSEELPFDAAAPYFTLPALWSLPGVTALVGPPEVGGLDPGAWWSWTLAQANPEYTNKGTFLMVSAELGTVGATAFWLVLGLVLGVIYARARQGNLTALVAVSVTYIGLLELPRLLYFTEGRAVPVYLGLLLVSYRLQRFRGAGDRGSAGRGRAQEPRPAPVELAEAVDRALPPHDTEPGTRR